MTAFNPGPGRVVQPEELPDASPVTLGEFWQKTWADQTQAANFNAHIVNYHDAFNATNERIKAATGEDLPNPMGAEQGFGASVGALMAFSREQVGALSPVQAWRQRVAELKAQHADKLDWDQIADEPDKVAWETMRRAREEAAAATARVGLASPTDVPLVGKIPVVGPLLGALPALGYNLLTAPRYTATQLAASLAAQMTSPADAAVNLLSFGAGGAAASLVKNAALNAAANAAGQALLSAPKQLSYKSAGLPYGAQVWAEEVAGAAGGGFAADLAIRGPARAAVSRFGRDVAPGEMLSRNTERGGLFRDVARPEIDPDLIKRADAGDIAATREILEKTGVIADPAVKYAIEKIERTAATIDGAAKAAADLGLADPKGMRDVADALLGRNRYLEAGERAAAKLDPEAGAVLAAKSEAAIAQLPAEVAEAVRDGLDAGMPKVLALVKELRPDTPVERIASAMDTRTLAETRILGGRAGPTEIARYIREWPDIIDPAHGLDGDHIDMAQSIARLDDAAFEQATSGAVAPQIAAHVADTVPREAQAQVLADVVRLKPRSLDEAKAAVAMLRPPDRAGGPARVSSGIADPRGADAKGQVDALKADHADAYEAATERARARDELEQRVETLRAAIAKGELAEKSTRSDAGSGKVEVLRAVLAGLEAERAKVLLSFDEAERRLAYANGETERTAGKSDQTGLQAEIANLERALSDISKSIADHKEDMETNIDLRHQVQEQWRTYVDMEAGRSLGDDVRTLGDVEAGLIETLRITGSPIDTLEHVHPIHNIEDVRSAFSLATKEQREKWLTVHESEALEDLRERHADISSHLEGLRKKNNTAVVERRTASEKVSAREQELQALTKEKADVEDRISDTKAKLEEAEARPPEMFADPETGARMERGEVDAFVDLWRFARDMRKAPTPVSLADFIRNAGGVQDLTRDVRHGMGEARARPGLVSERAMHPDDATLMAWEAGYLGSGERPGINALYDALTEDVNGNRVYSDRDAALAEDLKYARDAELELDRAGILGARTEAKIYEHFARAADRGAGDGEAVAGKAGAAEQRKELARLERELRQLQKPRKVPERTPEGEPELPIFREMEEADRASQMAMLIEACRA